MALLDVLTQKLIDILDGAGGRPSPMAGRAKDFKVGTRLAQLDPQNAYKSGKITADGTAQANAHGLDRIPSMVIVVPTDGNNGAGAAGTQFTNVAFTVDATSVTVTGTSGGKYSIYAW